MTGKRHSTDQNKGDDVQTKDEKLDGAKAETEEENQSEEIGFEPCVAPGAIQSDEDDKAARRGVSMKTLCVHKSGKGKRSSR